MARLEIDVRAFDPHLDPVAIAHSDGRVTETEAPLPETSAPLPGSRTAVTRWAGVHAHQRVRDPGERRRFMAIMPRVNCSS